MAYCQTMAQDSDSRSLDKVIVRLPDGMRDRIKTAAEANNRSMNAEIVATLDKAYPEPDGATLRRLVDLMQTVQESIDRLISGDRPEESYAALARAREQYDRFVVDVDHETQLRAISIHYAMRGIPDPTGLNEPIPDWE